MERLGSMLLRTWNNNNRNSNMLTVSTLNNDDDDMSSWEIIINPNDHDHDQQQHLSKYDDRPTIISDDGNDHLRLVGSLGINNNNNDNTVSDDKEPFRIDPPSSCFTPFPIDVMCDRRVCNRRLDEEKEEEDEVDERRTYDVEDNDTEYDYDDYDIDTRWLKKQRMTKVGKKVNNGMMKKSNKLPRYFYNKFV